MSKPDDRIIRLDNLSSAPQVFGFQGREAIVIESGFYPIKDYYYSREYRPIIIQGKDPVRILIEEERFEQIDQDRPLICYQLPEWNGVEIAWRSQPLWAEQSVLAVRGQQFPSSVRIIQVNLLTGAKTPPPGNVQLRLSSLPYFSRLETPFPDPESCLVPASTGSVVAPDKRLLRSATSLSFQGSTRPGLASPISVDTKTLRPQDWKSAKTLPPSFWRTYPETLRDLYRSFVGSSPDCKKAFVKSRKLFEYTFNCIPLSAKVRQDQEVEKWKVTTGKSNSFGCSDWKRRIFIGGARPFNREYTDSLKCKRYSPLSVSTDSPLSAVGLQNWSVGSQSSPSRKGSLRTIPSLTLPQSVVEQMVQQPCPSTNIQMPVFKKPYPAKRLPITCLQISPATSSLSLPSEEPGVKVIEIGDEPLDLLKIARDYKEEKLAGLGQRTSEQPNNQEDNQVKRQIRTRRSQASIGTDLGPKVARVVAAMDPPAMRDFRPMESRLGTKRSIMVSPTIRNLRSISSTFKDSTSHEKERESTSGNSMAYLRKQKNLFGPNRFNPDSLELISLRKARNLYGIQSFSMPSWAQRQMQDPIKAIYTKSTVSQPAHSDRKMAEPSTVSYRSTLNGSVPSMNRTKSGMVLSGLVILDNQAPNRAVLSESPVEEIIQQNCQESSTNQKISGASECPPEEKESSLSLTEPPLGTCTPSGLEKASDQSLPTAMPTPMEEICIKAAVKSLRVNIRPLHPFIENSIYKVESLQPSTSAEAGNQKKGLSTTGAVAEVPTPAKIDGSRGLKGSDGAPETSVLANNPISIRAKCDFALEPSIPNEAGKECKEETETATVPPPATIKEDEGTSSELVPALSSSITRFKSEQFLEPNLAKPELAKDVGENTIQEILDSKTQPISSREESQAAWPPWKGLQHQRSPQSDSEGIKGAADQEKDVSCWAIPRQFCASLETSSSNTTGIKTVNPRETSLEDLVDKDFELSTELMNISASLELTQEETKDLEVLQKQFPGCVKNIASTMSPQLKTVYDELLKET